MPPDPPENRWSTVSLRDIAREAGVSATTVSRALRDGHRVSQAKVAEIQAIARRLGYQPNPALQALVAHRQRKRPPHDLRNIVLINSWPDPHLPENDWFQSQYRAGARARARELGYDLTDYWMGDCPGNAAGHSRILFQRGIAGAILLPQRSYPGGLQLEWERFVLVTFGYSLQSPDLHRVAHFASRDMLTAIREIEALGYQRIGLVGRWDVLHRNLDQWAAALLFHGMRENRNHPPQFLVKDLTTHKQQLLEWYQQHRPEMILCTGSHETRVVEDLGRQLGMAIPVASLNTEPASPLSGIDQRPFELGIAAAEKLHSLMMRGEKGVPAVPSVTMIEGQWNPGTTLPPIR